MMPPPPTPPPSAEESKDCRKQMHALWLMYLMLCCFVGLKVRCCRGMCCVYNAKLRTVDASCSSTQGHLGHYGGSLASCKDDLQNDEQEVHALSCWLHSMEDKDRMLTQYANRCYFGDVSTLLARKHTLPAAPWLPIPPPPNPPTPPRPIALPPCFPPSARQPVLRLCLIIDPIISFIVNTRSNPGRSIDNT